VRSLGEPARGNNAGAATTAPAPRADMPARSEAPRGGGGGARGPLASAAPLQEPVARGAEAATPARALKTFDDLIALAAEKRDLTTKSALERDVRLVRFEDGRLEIGLEASAAKTLVGELSKKLNDWTGRRWMVVVSAEPGAPSVRVQAEQRKADLKNDVRGDPLVQAVLARFPGAEIVEVRTPAATTEDVPDTPPNESDLDA
jgi:DNA polymerase III subunit gamma/tau